MYDALMRNELEASFYGAFIWLFCRCGILLLYSIGKSVNKAVSLDEIQSIQDEYTSRKIGFNQKNHAYGK